MAMQKKSQAAFEFLTTYAWAFILIIIVIAAISYFGVLRPKQILPDRCTFNVGFNCVGYKIDSASGFQIALKNQLGDTIDVTTIDLKAEDESAITCDTPPVFPIVNWKIGERQELAWSGCTPSFSAVGLTKGEKGKIVVSINFYSKPAGSAYTRTAEGEVLATVQ